MRLQLSMDLGLLGRRANRACPRTSARRLRNDEKAIDEKQDH